MKLTQFLDKPVLGLYEAEEGGRVSGAVFDKRLKKLKYLLVARGSEEARLPLSAVAAVGPDAVLVRNLSLLTPAAEPSNCPVNAALYDTEGRSLGRVSEAVLDERRQTLFLEAGDTKYLPEQILSGGRDAVLVCLNGPVRRPSPPRKGPRTSATSAANAGSRNIGKDDRERINSGNEGQLLAEQTGVETAERAEGAGRTDLFRADAGHAERADGGSDEHAYYTGKVSGGPDGHSGLDGSLAHSEFFAFPNASAERGTSSGDSDLSPVPTGTEAGALGGRERASMPSDPGPISEENQLWGDEDGRSGARSTLLQSTMQAQTTANDRRILSNSALLHSTMQARTAPEGGESLRADEDWGGVVVVRPPYTIYADFSYLLGRKASARVIGPDGEILLEAGQKVTPAALAACKRCGRLLHLAKSCALHTLGPGA